MRIVRALLAQILLGWALDLDPDGVIEVVAEGIAAGERQAGKPFGSFARNRGITGHWGRVR